MAAPSRPRTPPAPPITIPVDVVIFGGGAAGLWLLDELRRRGRDALLLEAHQLGLGQTVASQGIIHGGFKYSLKGLLSPSARAIRDMPLLWRHCLAGECEPDLRGVRVRAHFCHLWRTSSVRSRMFTLGAVAGLRVSPRKLSGDERPAALRDCPGGVYRLDEQVLDPGTLLSVLADRNRDHVLKIDVTSGLELRCASPGEVKLVQLINPETGDSLDIAPRCVVLAAGAGNEQLRQAAGLPGGAMQRRPLHMVMLRGALPELNGHCIDGAATRLTVTTARDYAEKPIWQVGGQIAEDGVQMSPRQLIEHAFREIRAVLPAINLATVEWATYRADRAEPAHRGVRPEGAHAKREGNTITAWPTKLVLVPVLAQQIIRLIKKERRSPMRAGTDDDAPRETAERLPTRGVGAPVHPALNDWPRPIVALPPWETQRQWITDV